jgi:signal transduction histidine kinase
MLGASRRLLLLLTCVALLSGLARLPASEAPTVLVLYSDPTLLPATAAFTKGLREAVDPARMQFEAQYLDLSRFAGEADERAFAQWLASRYRDRPAAVVIALSVPASRFASRFGTAIWPQARQLHVSIDGEQLRAVRAQGHLVIPRVLEYRQTVESALALLPAVRRIILVAGASEQDRRWLAQADEDLAALGNHVRISRLVGLSWQEVLDTVSDLPDDTLVVPVSFFADANDRTFVPGEAVSEIARHTNRPVFVSFLSWIGSGAIGGLVLDTGDLGRHTATIVGRVLDDPDAVLPPLSDVPSRWIFDDVQLRRWRIPEDALPAGSVVINRQPSLWSQYRWHAIAAVALIAVQTLLIGGLLLQGARRRRAEDRVRIGEAALRMSYERIRRLAGRLIGAQEMARTRIARDLHDDVCQELASMSMAVADVKEREGNIRDLQTQNALAALQRRTQDLVQGVRRLSHDLHPSTLRHVGLAAALETHCIEVEQRYDVQVTCDVDTDLRALPGDTAVALFRIGQEALRNAATHGAARRVTLSIARNAGSLELVVKDDGKGFDCQTISRQAGGLGLVSMEERARLVDGDFVVVATAGQGTTVRATVPWPAFEDTPQRGAFT